jgi:hypothetical protein
MANEHAIALQNRRDQARRTVLKGAKIVFNDRKSAIDCRVRDLSAEGARLDFSSPQLLPHAFDLHVGDGPARRCGLRWAHGARAGVRFLDEAEEAAVQVAVRRVAMPEQEW